MPADERRGNGPDAEEPLVLTPEMRVDAVAVEAGARRSDEPGTVPDRDALRTMLREILRDELDGGPAEQAVRDIIRDELTDGEIGRNISQNVLRVVRSEIAKAVEPR